MNLHSISSPFKIRLGNYNGFLRLKKEKNHFVFGRGPTVYSRSRILFIIPFLMTFSLLLLLQTVAFCQSVPFQTIDKGEIPYFNYGDPNFLGAETVIRDKKTWAWFWEKHTQEVQPTPPTHRVDFRRERVLVVMLGYQTSRGGPSIEISSIEEVQGGASKGIRVFVKDNRKPGPTTIIANPYHIVKMKGSDPSVIFQHQPMDRPCLDNSECGLNEFSEKTPGNWSGTGIVWKNLKPPSKSMTRSVGAIAKPMATGVRPL
jgi:hypothetical protein